MNKVRMAVLLGLAATLAACSENTVAPTSQASPTPSSPVVQGSAADLASTDTVRFSITINPWQQTYFYLGAGNSLTFPAGSLCDPYKSSYGPTEWDKPCTVATSPVTINVKAWLDARQHAHVDFDKHVRFVPSLDPTKWVVLTFADLQASLDPFFNILYCATPTSVCVDESKTDATLLTVRNPITGKVTRRIKHFSGYNVAAGDDGTSDGLMSLGVNGGDRVMSVSTEDLSLDDEASVARAHPELSGSEVTDMLNNIRVVRKFSGYILASG